MVCYYVILTWKIFNSSQSEWSFLFILLVLQAMTDFIRFASRSNSIYRVGILLQTEIFNNSNHTYSLGRRSNQYTSVFSLKL